METVSNQGTGRFNLSKFLWDYRQRIGNLLGPDQIALQLVPSSAALWVAGDQDILWDAIIILALHARQTLIKGGIVLISTKPVTVDDKCCSSYGVVPGDYVELLVTEVCSDSIGVDSEMITTFHDMAMQKLELAMTKLHGRVRLRYLIGEDAPSFWILLPQNETTLKPISPPDATTEGHK